MSIADELQKLQTLRDSGALTDEEFAEAKARVLKGAPDDSIGAANVATSATAVLHKFSRSKSDVWLGGVCGGLAKITPVPAWVWRLGFAILICGYGIGFFAYICLWIFVPEETDATSSKVN